MFGYSRDDLLGQPVETLLPEAFRAVHVAHRQRFMGQPKTRPMGAGLSLSGLRVDGSEFSRRIRLPLSDGRATYPSSSSRNRVMKASALRMTTTLVPPNIAKLRSSSSTSASSARSPSTSTRCASGGSSRSNSRNFSNCRYGSDPTSA